MRTRRLVLAVGLCGTVLTAALVLILFLQSDRRGETVIFFNSEDERLIKSVWRAELAQVSPNEAESVVGVKASLDTRTEEDANRWKTLNVEDDPSAGGILPDLQGAAHAMYWIRPTEAEYRRIVGLLWFPDGRVQVFFGQIHPGRRG
jgi:hypothetical protein